MMPMKFLADRKEAIDLPQSLQIKLTTKRFEFLLAVQRDDWNFEESSPASKVKEVRIDAKEVMDFIDVWDNEQGKSILSTHDEWDEEIYEAALEFADADPCCEF